MTKPKPPNEIGPHPRALAGPLAEQPVPVRRNRARQRAMIKLAKRYADEYRGLYWEQLKEVGLE